MLADMPGLGVARPDIAPSLRMLTERPYLILYRISPDDPAGKVDTLEVVRIVDGRRDLPDLF